MTPSAPNYDEAKANPIVTLPDPLILKNGRKVRSAAVWWKQRRPEIVEDFNREVYGRAPQDTPSVRWEVVRRKEEKNGQYAVIANSCSAKSTTLPIRRLMWRFNLQ